jgi:hyperosmotically inducible periplasmic protein
MIRSFQSVVCGVVLSGALLVPSTLPAGQNPDNAAANKQDRNTTQPTADQAKNTTSDREMMQRIRRDIVDDKSLSTYAHNVKIIAKNGKVTLRGPVHSDDEKRTIEEYARKVAGEGNVTSELTVKGDQK